MSKSPDAFRTISEVAEWLAVQAHVLRFWESKFTQLKPVKRAGGRRYYRPADMMLLGGIRYLLHDKGLPIKEVQAMLRDQGTGSIAELSHSLDAPFTPGSAGGGNKPGPGSTSHWTDPPIDVTSKAEPDSETSEAPQKLPTPESMGLPAAPPPTGKTRPPRPAPAATEDTATPQVDIADATSGSPSSESTVGAADMSPAPAADMPPVQQPDTAPASQPDTAPAQQAGLVPAQQAETAPVQQINLDLDADQAAEPSPPAPVTAQPTPPIQAAPADAADREHPQPAAGATQPDLSTQTDLWTTDAPAMQAEPAANPPLPPLSQTDAAALQTSAPPQSPLSAPSAAADVTDDASHAAAASVAAAPIPPSASADKAGPAPSDDISAPAPRHPASPAAPAEPASQAAPASPVAPVASTPALDHVRSGDPGDGSPQPAAAAASFAPPASDPATNAPILPDTMASAPPSAAPVSAVTAPSSDIQSAPSPSGAAVDDAADASVTADPQPAQPTVNQAAPAQPAAPHITAAIAPADIAPATASHAPTTSQSVAVSQPATPVPSSPDVMPPSGPVDPVQTAPAPTQHDIHPEAPNLVSSHDLPTSATAPDQQTATAVQDEPPTQPDAPSQTLTQSAPSVVSPQTTSPHADAAPSGTNDAAPIAALDAAPDATLPGTAQFATAAESAPQQTIPPVVPAPSVSESPVMSAEATEAPPLPEPEAVAETPDDLATPHQGSTPQESAFIDVDNSTVQPAIADAPAMADPEPLATGAADPLPDALPDTPSDDTAADTAFISPEDLGEAAATGMPSSAGDLETAPAVTPPAPGDLAEQAETTDELSIAPQETIEQPPVPRIIEIADFDVPALGDLPAGALGRIAQLREIPAQNHQPIQECLTRLRQLQHQ